MNSKSQIIWTALACGIVATFSIYFAMNSDPIEEQGPKPPQEWSSVSVKVQNNNVKASGNQTEPPVAKHAMHSMHVALAHAPDLRALLEKFKQQPEDGGAYYASAILSHCFAVRSTFLEANRIETKNVDRAWQAQNAKTRLKDTCMGFLDSELGISALKNLSKLGERDPLMKLELTLRQHNPDNYATSISTLIASNSPELIQKNLFFVDEKGVYFDGQVYAANSKENALLFRALPLALCETGRADCEKNSFLIAQACANMDRCAENIEEVTRFQIDEWSDRPAEDMEIVREFARKIEIALKNNDSNPFIPKKMSGGF